MNIDLAARPKRKVRCFSRHCRVCHEITDFAAARITWSRLTTAQIEALREEAGSVGDLKLVHKADRALARRRGAK